MKNTFILFLFLIITQTVWSQEKQISFAEIRTPHKALSPFISKLQKLDSVSLSHEINKLWIKIKNEGAPLIEKDPYFDDYLHLTFIYQENTNNKDISFEVFGIYDEYRFGDMRLHRLKGTDLFYRCYMIPDDLCFSYRFILNDTIKGEKQTITDPLNKALIPTGEKKRHSWSVLDLRSDEAEWYTKRYGNTGSKLDTFRITSKLMENTRNIYVYLPPGYKGKNTEYPVMYLFDSPIYLNRIEVPNVLDNLIKEGRIEPMIAVMIDNPTSTSRLYELPLNPQFKDFMIKELVPQIKARYGTTNNPDKTIIGGMSYGGLASTYIVFHCPDVFGKVLSQSGSFWRDLEWYDSNGVDLRGDWLTNQFLTEDNKRLKLFLDWGLQENWCLSSGRRLVRVLDKKGYTYKFMEFNGWHDWSNSRKTFPLGLMYLLEEINY